MDFKDWILKQEDTTVGSLGMPEPEDRGLNRPQQSTEVGGYSEKAADLFKSKNPLKKKLLKVSLNRRSEEHKEFP